MGWLKNLFSGSSSPKEPIKETLEAPERDPEPVDMAKAIQLIENSKLSPLAESLVGQLEPCIVVDAERVDGLPPEASRFGGRPGVPSAFEWPMYEKKPLAFLAQLRMKDVKPHDPKGLLPDDGWMYFFYCDMAGTWGFDPKDRGSFRVMYFPSGEDLSFAEVPGKLKSFHECRLSFVPVMTLPGNEDFRGPGGTEIMEFMDENDLYDEYGDLETEIQGGRIGCHHLFGHPQPVQNGGMDVDCQLVTNGHYLGGDYPSGPEIDELTSRANEWVLLFQIDMDDGPDWMWGDAGTLYFWIRKEDLKARVFENIWMFLQCC